MATPSIPVSAAVVHAWHCDHFGHMNTRNHAALFDDAIFLFWNQMGSEAPGAEGNAVVPVTAEMKTSFLLEAKAGTCVAIDAQVTRIGTKSVGLRLEMRTQRTGAVLAVCDVVEVFFATASRSSQPIPATVRQQLEKRCPPVAV